MREALIIDGVRTPRGKGKPSGALHDIHPQELLAQVLNALAARASTRRTSTTSSSATAAATATTASASAAWPCSRPDGRSRRPASRSTASADLGSRPSPSARWASAPASRIWWSPAASSRCRASCRRAVLPTSPRATTSCASATRSSPRASPPTSSPRWRASPATTSTPSRSRARRGPPSPRPRAGSTRASCAVHHADGTVALDRDEHPRPGTTLEGLAGLNPSFQEMGTTTFEGFDRSFDEMCAQAYPQIEGLDHVHHGGNSSGVVDGAPAVVLASEDYAKAHGLTPRARVVMHAVAGTEPVIMLTRSGTRDREGARAGRDDGRRHRSLRDQRGVRRRSRSRRSAISTSIPRR